MYTHPQIHTHSHVQDGHAGTYLPISSYTASIYRYICMYIHTNICIYIYTYTYIYTHAHTYTHIFTSRRATTAHTSL